MITNFKIYENISIPYKIGDYVIVIFSIKGEYIETLAKIIQINRTDIHVKIENYESNNLNFPLGSKYICNTNQIKCWSENKEELEMLIQSNKYNL